MSTTTYILTVDAEQLRIIKACLEDRAAHYTQRMQAHNPERWPAAHEHYSHKLDVSYAVLTQIDKLS